MTISKERVLPVTRSKWISSTSSSEITRVLQTSLHTSCQKINGLRHFSQRNQTSGGRLQSDSRAKWNTGKAQLVERSFEINLVVCSASDLVAERLKHGVEFLAHLTLHLNRKVGIETTDLETCSLAISSRSCIWNEKPCKGSLKWSLRGDTFRDRWSLRRLQCRTEYLDI